MNRWFRARERVFLYHYQTYPQVDEQWQDLALTGCRYVAWVPLNHQTRGEIWLYPTQRHKVMIQMVVPANNLIWKKDFLSLLREKNKRSREYARQMSLLRQKHGPFWFYE
jgi:flavin-dependent dehydrogenase